MLRKLFGLGPKADIAGLIGQGAIIVDVRTKGEFAGGHMKGSVNIPLDQLLQNLNRIPKNKPVITCCASGMRSSAAANTLRDHGFNAHNGGPWIKVQMAIS